MSSEYIIIKVKDMDSLQKEYAEFEETAEKMKAESKGLINLYKSGTVVTTALNLFKHFTKSIDQPDTIYGVEGDYILYTYRGGIMKAVPYEGIAFQSDVCSMYAYIMQSKMTFPYKEGQFKILTQAEMTARLDKNGRVYYMYGIYRCIITGDINPFLFRENKYNYYTHICLEVAQSLGYTITLIEDGSCNFL